MCARIHITASPQAHNILHNRMIYTLLACSKLSSYDFVKTVLHVCSIPVHISITHRNNLTVFNIANTEISPLLTSH